MGELKDIVPPPELCKLIPDGEFSNSALVWRVVRNTTTGERLWDDVFPRDCGQCGDGDEGNYPAAGHVIASAPTLKEVMAELGQDYIKVGVDFRCYWICYVTDHYGDEIAETDNGNPATAALKLWLKLKGIEYVK